MKIETPDWMHKGTGRPPDMVQSFRSDAKMTGFEHMREAGDFAVSDEIGTLYLLDPLLNVSRLNRLQEPARQLAWSDTGDFGSALIGEHSIARISHKLKIVWTVDVPFSCSTIAIDPYGVFTLVASKDGGVIMLDDRGKRAATFETMRPLAHAEFLIDDPIVVVAADHGLLAAYGVGGHKIWEQTLWSNVGDLDVVQKTSRICLAALNQGLQIYNGQGDTEASMIVEGTVNRISTSYAGDQAFAATVENHIYRIDADGELLWAAVADEAIRKTISHAIDPVGVIVFANDRAFRVAWE